MAKARRYAYSIQWGDYAHGNDHAVGLIEARNKGEAEILAYDRLRVEKHRPDGWRFVSVKVCVVKEPLNDA